MNKLDTGKLTIQVVGDRYLHMVIYTDGELTSHDIPAVIGFLDQFDGPVPALVERAGNYSISAQVQMELYTQAKRRLKAAAYVDRNRREAVLTKLAAETYFKHTRVRSFLDRQQAVEWLERSYCTAPIRLAADGKD